ncbi:spore coat protein SP96-like [Scylla paramamosain]|uniref:spore coat protein SP96-like n=1 Tax=Scylla paramamosain TaxID=85552 RepID=UPI0030827738
MPYFMSTFELVETSTCKEENTFKCLNCKVLAVCVNNIAYPHECDVGYTCEIREDFGGAVCYPVGVDTFTNCTCSGRSELLPDPYDQSAFLKCSPGEKIPTVYSCQEDTLFDEITGTCEYPEDHFDCPSYGIFANPDDCSKYFRCIPVENKLMAFSEYCDCGLSFNDITGQCEDACAFQKQEFVCEKEGRFADPYDCEHYYLCRDMTTVGGTGLAQVRLKCPEDSIFTATTENYGYCESTIHSNPVCNVIPVPSCPVPEGRNCSHPTPTPGGECIVSAPFCLCNASDGNQYCEDGYEGNGQTCQPLPSTKPPTSTTTTTAPPSTTSPIPVTTIATTTAASTIPTTILASTTAATSASTVPPTTTLVSTNAPSTTSASTVPPTTISASTFPPTTTSVSTTPPTATATNPTTST